MTFSAEPIGTAPADAAPSRHLQTLNRLPRMCRSRGAGHAPKAPHQHATSRSNAFEKMLVENGTVILKFIG